MRGLAWVAIACVALAIPVVVLAAGAGAGGFDGVVSSLESRYQVHATRIPFLGMVSLVAGAATGGGVHGLHVAEFERLTAPVDGEELNQLVAQKLGQGWERVVRETSRKGHEQTLVFMHPEGRRMGLFVVDLDGEEMDVVQISIDPRYLSHNINHYSHMDSSASRVSD